jgi:hypothetical protein
MDFDFDAVGNFGYGTVLTAPSPSTSGVTVELNPGEGDLFPNPSPNPYNVTAYPEATGPLLSNAEIWRVTAKAGDALTIIRAQEGTSAKAVQVGWQVAMAPTAKVIQDIQNAINAASGVTPGSYTYAQITVDEQGRVTSAASGAAPGSVTSVGLAMPNIFSVSGSPVTGAGTLTSALATQAANLVFAGPTTGSANTPTFRSLVAADIPDLSLVYQPLNAKLTAIAALANASGWLKNNGSGTFSYSTPTKSDVGLGNADNTSDANKPVSTATQTALNLKADLTLLGAASGIATLGVDQKLTASQLPAIAITEFLGSVASQAAMLALVGQQGDWCIRTDSGLTYVITGPDPTQLTDWTSLSYPTAPVLSVAGRTGVVVLTSADVGLGNVDNTADSAKTFTTAQITSGTFAAARMPAFTGDATSTAGTVALTVVKINGVSLAGLATGILKNTTATGAPSIAVAADFPTLNQNTTGSAATLTTARAIYGNNFDGSIALTQIIASTFGGTGNGFTKFSGPATTEKTFTLPNSSETLLYAGGALGTPSGGTVTNLTGTASININGTVGATTPGTGSFTTLAASGATNLSDLLTITANGSANALFLRGRSSDGIAQLQFRNNANSAVQTVLTCDGSSLFTIGTGSGGTGAFAISGTQAIRFNTYGAGALTTDASGNITAASDERLKDIRGKFKLGVAALRGISPILHKWKKSSGNETKNTYAGFSAQNVQKYIPEAVGKMNNAEKHLTLSDRPILATVVNAINEIDRRLEKLEKLALAL